MKALNFLEKEKLYLFKTANFGGSISFAAVGQRPNGGGFE